MAAPWYELVASGLVKSYEKLASPLEHNFISSGECFKAAAFKSYNVTTMENFKQYGLDVFDVVSSCIKKSTNEVFYTEPNEPISNLYENFYTCTYQHKHPNWPQSPFSECLEKKDEGYAICLVTWLCIVFAFYSLVWSIIGQNCSKVDQIWSITPWLYCWLFYLHDLWVHNGKDNAKLLLICICTTTWGLRLTFNFWMKGGYGNLIVHEEDYRWPILRKFINNSFLFFIFNVTFIAGYQNLLLLLIALPTYYAGLSHGSSDKIDSNKDYMVALAFFVFLAFESLADLQHWNFHAKKSKAKAAAAASSNYIEQDPDVRDGFFQSGLFKYSRHPNYFCEQSMWVCVYLFSINLNSWSDCVNVSILGPILLILLFQGSMMFGEHISCGKYPQYKAYQARTSQCFPTLPGPRLPPQVESTTKPPAATPSRKERKVAVAKESTPPPTPSSAIKTNTVPIVVDESPRGRNGGGSLSLRSGKTLKHD